MKKFILFLILFFTSPVLANDVPELLIKNPIETELTYLFSLLDNKNNNFDKTKIKEILNFINSKKDLKNLYYIDNKEKSVYYEIEIDKKFNDLVILLNSLKIPPYLFALESTGFSKWESFHSQKDKENLKNIDIVINNLTNPIFIRGLYYKETTPNNKTQSYYASTNDKLLILLEDNKKIFIAISKQKGQSLPSKKGLVVGKIEDWNFLYSNIEGMGKSGLSWVKSYIYDYKNIEIIIEEENSKSKIASFSWVEAGWSGLNVVKRNDIYEGCIRYEKSLKKALLNKNLPHFAELVKDINKIKNFNDLKKKETANKFLEEISKKDIPENWKDLIVSGEYLKNLNENHLEALLMVSYMKEIQNPALANNHN